jgi:hypothetical protein
MADTWDDLRKRYAALTVEELCAIANLEPHQYRPEAVRIAQEELVRRGVSAPEVAEIHEGIATETRARLATEEQSLSAGLKALCLILPGVPGLAVYSAMVGRGRRRAARQAIQWCLMGVGVWFLLSVLCVTGHACNLDAV